jgi:MFS family permease
MNKIHHHGIHLLHFKLNEGLKEMYASISLRTFAYNLVGIFVPIYLYTLGYPVLDILLYFIVFHLSHALISVFVAGKLARKFGVKHLMLFSTPFIFVALLLLGLLQFGVGTPLPVLAFVLACSNSMYWVGFHCEFSKSSDRRHRGQQVSFFNVLASIFSALGPVIGGFIIVSLGYYALYALVLFVLIVSVIPLLRSQDFSGNKNYSIRKLFHKRDFRKDFLPPVLFGITASIFVSIWPLLMHIKGVFLDESGLGVVFTVSFFVGVILALYAGRLADRVKSLFGIMKISNVVFAFIWVGRWLANSVGFLFGTEILAGFNRPFYSIPYEKHEYARMVRSRNVIEYTVFKEAAMHTMSAAVLFLIWLYGDIFISYFVASAAHLLVLFI